MVAPRWRHTRELYTHWDDETRVALAALHPEDRQLAQLIGQLAMQSPTFAALWSRHPVRNCTVGTKHFHHPLVGSMELTFESMQFSDGSGHRALMYSATPGTPSEAALRLLADAAQAGARTPAPGARTPADRS